jgi:hypothetical protein
MVGFVVTKLNDLGLESLWQTVSVSMASGGLSDSLQALQMERCFSSQAASSSKI